MKISCLPVSLFQELISGEIAIHEWAKIASDIGFDGFDISVMFIRNKTPKYLRELKASLSDSLLPMIMMSTYTDFSNPDPIQRKREMEYLRHDIALCSQLNVRYLRITAGQAHPCLCEDEAITWVVQSFKEAGIVAKEYGVQLLFEDHAKPGAWDYVDFCFDPEIFLKICEGIKDTGIRINFDTGNITAFGADPLAILNQVYEQVETIHLSDMATCGKFSPTLIGEGVVPNHEILQLLKQRDFKGWICLEEASYTGIPGIKTAFKNTKRMINEGVCK